jgi:hypothetical protein
MEYADEVAGNGLIELRGRAEWDPQPPKLGGMQVPPGNDS